MKKGRNAHGVYLLEVLVAIVLGSIITLAMLSALSQTMRQSSTSLNELYANSIAHELLEHLQTMSYSTLSAYSTGGTYSLLVNRGTLGQIGPVPRPGPVSMDFANLAWTPKTENNAFNGSVDYRIEPYIVPPSQNAVLVTIAVRWNDSQNIGGPTGSAQRTIVTTGVISEFGTNYWN